MMTAARPISKTLALAALALAACGDPGVTPSVVDDPEVFPGPVVAGTPETDALAESAGRCAQPDFAWVRQASLGDVVAHEAKGSFDASTISVLLGASGAVIPEGFSPSYDVDTYLVAYDTQDRGEPIQATAFVAWPSTVPADAAPIPTLLVLHGTSGFTDGCGPSVNKDTTLLAAAIASLGFIVVAPDYIGLSTLPPATGFLHPYLVGQATAIASLDAVRAVGKLPMELRVGGARPSPRTVVLGGSQGGHAALWVDRLAPYYARELQILGIAATVPPADMLGESQLGLQTVRSSTSNVMAFLGASAGWYGVGEQLNTAFVPPYDVDIPAALGASCDPSDALDGVSTLEQVFQPELLEAAASGTLASTLPWGCIIAENGLTTTSVPRIQEDPPSYGVLFVTGDGDTLVDTPTERVAYEALCSAGTPMRYLECAGASHTKVTAWALPEMLTFLRDRLDGKDFVSDCSTPAATRCEGTPSDQP